MNSNIEERACELAAYIVENRATVRAAAKKYGVSKSTVHMDVTVWNAFYGRLHNARRVKSDASQSFADGTPKER